jgi:uncharacterized membrane protein YjjP (DUF1212 family)
VQARFILELGRLLHRYGSAAYRIEEALGACAARFGLEAQFFSTPTSVFAAFGPQHAQQTMLVRLEPGQVDLGKLSDLYALLDEVLAGRVDASAGLERLAALERRTARHPVAATLLGFALGGGAGARLFGGGLAEVLAAAGAGVALGALNLAVRRSVSFLSVFEALAAALATLLVRAASRAFGPFDVPSAVLGSLAPLLPGLTITIALRELATRHLASGTARLMGALVVLVTLAVGFGIGGQLGSTWFGDARAAPVPLPPGTEWLAVLVASCGFALLLGAPSRDLPWILLAGAVAFGGMRTGVVAFGPELGPSVGAFAVGAWSNVHARLTRRPAAITFVPGLLVLVPGSLGFRGMTALLDQPVPIAAQHAVAMLITAGALVAGGLLANVAVPPRRDRLDA